MASILKIRKNYATRSWLLTGIVACSIALFTLSQFTPDSIVPFTGYLSVNVFLQYPLLLGLLYGWAYGLMGSIVLTLVFGTALLYRVVTGKDMVLFR